jgi:hypothetical protein
LGAVRLVFGAEFRLRWKSWVALALLVALVAGSVLAAAAAGRRTASAFSRFVAAHGYDVLVYSFQPVPRLGSLPNVSSVTPILGPANGPPTCLCTHPINSYNFSMFEVSPTALPRVVKLVSGRMPNQSVPDEALASFTLQRDSGVHVGTVMRIPFFALSQQQAVFGPGNVVPAGPVVKLRVVGIEASEGEFPSGTPSYGMYTTSAFAREVNPKTPLFHSYLVRLRHGAADIPRFGADANSLGAFGISDLDSGAATVGASIHPQAVGWWVLAVLAGVAGLAVIGQALGRQAVAEGAAYDTLAALGVSSRQRASLGLARTGAVALAGAAVGVVVAAAFSPLTPVGEARLADPSPGFAFDGLVLGLGTLAVVVVVLALGLWPALRAARLQRTDMVTAPARPSRVVAALAAAGAPPSALIGVRHALERGRGRTAVPVGTALLGTVLAVTALCGTAVFGASLSHLTASPDLYGDAYHLLFTSNGQSVVTGGLVSDLEHDRAVSRITLGVSHTIAVNGVTVDAVAGTPLRGSLLLSNASGRLPDGDGQISLGATTMRQAGAHIGSVVRVTLPLPGGGTHVAPLRVVGTTSFPPDFPGGGLGRGAASTIHGYISAVCPPGPTEASCRTSTEHSLTYVVLARFTPGSAGRAAFGHYLATYTSNTQVTANLPITPANLINFGEAVNFPLILGVVLALFGGATLTHLLVLSVARRRPEMGLLKALGFLNRQVAAGVAWQATTVVLVGVVVGVPLGIAAGNVAWRAFAANIGVVPVSVVTAWVIVALAVGALVLANLLAVLPAVVAARSRPGELLRTT